MSVNLQVLNGEIIYQLSVEEQTASTDRIAAQAAAALAVSSKNITIENTEAVLAAKVIVDEKTAEALASADASEVSRQATLVNKNAAEASATLASEKATLATTEANRAELAVSMGVPNGGPISTASSPVAGTTNRVYFPTASGTYTNFSGLVVDITTGLNIILGNSTSGFQKIVVPVIGYVSPYLTNLSLVDRWASYKKVPFNLADRFYNGDGFQNSEFITYELKKADTLFGYSGNYINCKLGLTNNFWYFLDKTRFYNNPSFVTTVYFNIELISPINRNISVRLFRVTATSTETSISTVNVTLTSNVKTIVPVSMSLLGPNSVENVRGIEVRFFTQDLSVFSQDLYIGRILSSVSPLSVGEIEKVADYQLLVRSNQNRIPEDINLTNISCWGDSLTAQGYPELLKTVTSRSVVTRGYGGERSYQLRDRFLAQSNIFTNTQVFWVGRNNYRTPLFIENVIDDLETMINSLGHNRFIVLSILNGDILAERRGTSDFDKLIELDKKMSEIYGVRFLNIRMALINTFDSGFKLTNTFIQPTIASNVQITLNTTTGLAATNVIRIGEISLFDEYTIMSIDSSTLATIRLNVSNRINVGANVQNEYYDFNGQASTGYLKILKKQDSIDLIDGVIPNSLRTDFIHLTTVGYQKVANIISKTLSGLGF